MNVAPWPLIPRQIYKLQHHSNIIFFSFSLFALLRPSFPPRLSVPSIFCFAEKPHSLGWLQSGIVSHSLLPAACWLLPLEIESFTNRDFFATTLSFIPRLQDPNPYK